MSYRRPKIQTDFVAMQDTETIVQAKENDYTMPASNSVTVFLALLDCPSLDLSRNMLKSTNHKSRRSGVD